jgi:MoaA/NifB/PqqE/SkfB family radical SAM enzyme
MSKVQNTPIPWAGTESASVEALPIRNVFLHVTKACNLACKYCYFSARKPMADEMRTEEFLPVWPEIVALRPQKLVFTGGEPLLRDDSLDLMRGLRTADPQHRVLRCLNTNGHLVTPDLARSLVGLADEVRVSLDGLQERNDALRGRGNFDAALRALDCLYAVGFEPKVLITLTAMNAPDLEELLCLLFEKGYVRININGFRPIGRGQGHWDWRAAAHDTPGAIRRAGERCGRQAPQERAPAVQEPQKNCGVGTMLNIMPNGDVFPCHVLTDPQFRIGNIREKCLLHICSEHGLLGQLAALDFRKLARQGEQLATLAHPGTCMGNVYAKTKAQAIWDENLPGLGTQALSSEAASDCAGKEAL